jgi:hypothetical protein
MDSLWIYISSIIIVLPVLIYLFFYCLGYILKTSLLNKDIKEY